MTITVWMKTRLPDQWFRNIEKQIARRLSSAMHERPHRFLPLLWSIMVNKKPDTTRLLHTLQRDVEDEHRVGGDATRSLRPVTK